MENTDNWRDMITDALASRGETWADMVAFEPAERMDTVLDARFDAGYGAAEGEPFALWTGNYVYFPHEYDGSESVYSVSRHPNGKPYDHSGS
jgi:hypothetical protein